MTSGSNRNEDGPGPQLRGSRNNSSASATTTNTVEEHRRKLEALFSGGPKDPTPVSRPMPTPEKEQVFSSPRKSTGRAPSEYRLRLERLRMAREVNEIKEAADAFLTYHQLPDDADILYKLLQHPTEKVIREALGQISSLIIQGRIANTILLDDHLNTLTKRIQEDATRSYVDGVRAQLAKMKK